MGSGPCRPLPTGRSTCPPPPTLPPIPDPHVAWRRREQVLPSGRSLPPPVPPLAWDAQGDLVLAVAVRGCIALYSNYCSEHRPTLHAGVHRPGMGHDGAPPTPVPPPFPPPLPHALPHPPCCLRLPTIAASVGSRPMCLWCGSPPLGSATTGRFGRRTRPEMRRAPGGWLRALGWRWGPHLPLEGTCGSCSRLSARTCSLV
jgi:hypothetical protein